MRISIVFRSIKSSFTLSLTKQILPKDQIIEKRLDKISQELSDLKKKKTKVHVFKFSSVMKSASIQLSNDNMTATSTVQGFRAVFGDTPLPGY